MTYLEAINECKFIANSTSYSYTQKAMEMAIKALEEVSENKPQCQNCTYCHADFDGYDAVCGITNLRVEFNSSCDMGKKNTK